MYIRDTYIRTVFAVMFLVMTLVAPVAKNYHVAYHVDNMETTGDVVSEVCTLCDMEFPAFEETDNTLAVNVIEREYCIFVPSIIGNLCNTPIESLVIRGPPEV